MNERVKPARVPRMTFFKVRGIEYAKVRLPESDPVTGKRRQRTVSLGRAGEPETEERYRQVLAQHLTTGYAPKPRRRDGQYAVTHLCADFLRWAGNFYGPRSPQVGKVRAMISALEPLCGSVEVTKFRALDLDALRQAVLANGAQRSTAATYASVVRKMFKWGFSREVVPHQTYASLCALEPLRDAAGGKRQPVADADVDATLPHLHKEAQAIVRLLRLTGARPSELLGLRPCDMDMSGDVWSAVLAEHKTAHKGQRRTLYFGPAAQELLRDRMTNRATNTPLFQRYNRATLAVAIRRACGRAGIPAWTPYQLRHAYATNLAQRFGREKARLLMGHVSAAMTEHYIARDDAQAMEVARAIG